MYCIVNKYIAYDIDLACGYDIAPEGGRCNVNVKDLELIEIYGRMLIVFVAAGRKSILVPRISCPD